MNISEGWGPKPTTSVPGRVVAALSRQRRRVLDLLGPEPVAVSVVAEAVGVHPNTAREHLDGLVEQGLAERSRLAPSGRGRPGWGYAAQTDVTDHLPDEYSSLAGVLADFVAERSPDVAGDMVRLGRGWGSRLMSLRSGRRTVPVEPPRTGTSDPAAVEVGAEVAGPEGAGPNASSRVVELLGELGFAPQTDPDAIRLRQCPMLEVARERPEVVCSVHRGLVEGAVATASGSPDTVRLEPFAEPGACLLHLD